MKQYQPNEIATFLRAVDEHLEKPDALLLIGGGAMLIGYGVPRPTRDIDLCGAHTASVTNAIRSAQETTGLHIHVETPGVVDAPYNFEDRLQRAELTGLRKLTIWVPERHDLVLMKTLRGSEHDLHSIAELHTRQPLDPEVLFDRFHGEMSHAIGDPSRLRGLFLFMVESTFGTKLAVSYETRSEAFQRQVPKQSSKVEQKQQSPNQEPPVVKKKKQKNPGPGHNMGM